MTLLKGGAGAFFSDRCKALLAQAGYMPEDFGSYSYVADRLRQARTAVAGYSGNTGTVNIGGQPVPIEHARYLAQCESGHLQQDGVMRQAGGRGDPCANVVDGYESTQYPCMPHQGGARDPGTEHNTWSIQENTQPGALPPNGTYPRATMEQHADERTRQLLASERPANPRATASSASGLGAAPGVEQGGGSGGAGGAGDGSASAPGAPGDNTIDGETAADCINNFRKKGELAMQQSCAANRSRNTAVANGGPGRTDAEGAEHRRNLATRRDEAHARREEARAQHPEGHPERERAERAYTRAARRSSRAENANCRRIQGDRIAAGENRTDGRVPEELSGLGTRNTQGAADEDSYD